MKTTVSSKPIARPKLKLQSKKLKSGKVQVKFSITSSAHNDCYGYVLTDAATTLKEVVNSIQLKLSLLKDADQYYHQHLYSLNKSKLDVSQMMLFWKN